MTWIFSKAFMDSVNSPSLQGLVEEYSAASCSDGEQSAQLNVMPTQHKFWRNDKTMEFSRLSQFGLRLNLLTESRGAELLTLYLAAFPARTSASQGRAPESQESAADCGQKWRGSLAKFDPVSRSLKTAQLSLIEDLTGCSPILPRWGSMRNGECYPQPMLELLTCEKESGFWPTPCADDTADRAVPNSVHLTKNGLPKYVGPDGVKSMMRLSQAVKMWPTPAASDANKWSNQTLEERKQKGQQVRLSTAVSPEGGRGGLLNPQWEEWLMGWPIGWTKLERLGTDKSLYARLQHSVCSQKERELVEEES